MGKRTRSHTNNTSSPDGDLEVDLLKPVRPASPIANAITSRPSGLSDRRRWGPDRLDQYREPVRDMAGRSARTVHRAMAPKVRRGPGGKPLRSTRYSLWSLTRDVPAFHHAKTVYICLQRKIRREIFFAKKLKGKGGSRRRNDYSNIRC